MHPSCAGEASHTCFNSCLPSPLLASEESHNTSKSNINNATTGSNSNYDFATATSSTLQPYTQFTNHESLPSLQESYINFTKAFPQFSTTSQVDQIRAQDYYHLKHSNICFDYTGYGLFSYAQKQRFCPTISNIASSSSSSSLSNSALEPPPLFDISYKSVNLHSQIVYGGHESEIESRIRERIMRFMNISEADYTLVFIANEVSAFKLVADSYQFQSNGDLLTVYDHNSEALDMMIESCKKQGVHILSAEFNWPNFGIEWRKLKKMIMSKREKKKRGLFVFPLHSRVTGAPYSYIWMSMAQENGWHVLLDVCALRPKEMETLGMSMFKPDFMVCSFYKVFGENPSGFGCLFVKKSSISSIKDSGNATSIGIVSLVPAFRQTSQVHEESIIGDEETEPKAVPVIKTSQQYETEEEKGASTSSEIVELSIPFDSSQQYETKEEKGASTSSEIVELSIPLDSSTSRKRLGTANESMGIECGGLDHADSVGLIVITCRTKYLTNWLVNALTSLQHPHPENGLSLIRIYGPKINPHRGPSVAFNIFDWKGEKVDPTLVQKLADRNNISLSCAFLQNIRFLDKNEEVRQRALEKNTCKVEKLGLSMKRHNHACGIFVVTIALGFLTNFEDTYRLWAFLSRFLDADFVEKERWRYMALNQKTIEM